MAEPPIEALLPAHVVAALPAVAAGSAFAVTATEFELTQPKLFISFTVYTVETVGVTVAVAVVAVNPAGSLVHE